VISKLGEGAFGQVFRVKRLADGKEYALKKVLLEGCR
jgi:serine/threonine protein kinase